LLLCKRPFTSLFLSLSVVIINLSLSLIISLVIILLTQSDSSLLFLLYIVSGPTTEKHSLVSQVVAVYCIQSQSHMYTARVCLYT
jgi:hypothetical protein